MGAELDDFCSAACGKGRPQGRRLRMASAEAAAAKAAAALMAQSHKTGPSHRMRCCTRTSSEME